MVREGSLTHSLTHSLTGQRDRLPVGRRRLQRARAVGMIAAAYPMAYPLPLLARWVAQCRTRQPRPAPSDAARSTAAVSSTRACGPMPLPAPPARIRSTSLLHVCSHNGMRRSVLARAALVAFLATARTRLLGACSGAAPQHRALRRNIARCVVTSRAVCSHAPCWHRGRGCSAPSALSRCRHDRHCARQRAPMGYGRV